MNAEYKTKWVEALRSGKYKQGTGLLRTWTGRFCCLGVLCDLVEPEGWEIKRPTGNDARPYYMFRLGSESDGQLVPKEARERVELDLKSMRRLADLNDVGHKTFKDLALYIEKNL